MLKKIVSLAISTALLTSAFTAMAETGSADEALLISSAEEALALEAGQTKEYTLTLDEAIEMALKDNPQFVSLDVKIKNAESQADYAKKAMKDMQDYKKPIKLPDQLSMVAVRKGYSYEAALISVETAKLEKQKAMDKLAYNVTEQYFNVKLAERAVTSMNESYALAQKNKQTMDTQFELGMVSELEKKEIDIMVQETENAYNNQLMNLELARESLKLTLQIYDKDAVLNLTDDINYVEFAGNLEEGIKEAENNRYDLYSLKRNYDLTVLYGDIAKLCGEHSSEYFNANNNIVQAEYTYTNTKKLIALSIRSAYNAIKSAGMEISAAESRLKLLKNQSEVAKLKYELGMIGNTEYMQAVNAVYNQQTVYESALLKHKLATEKYGYEISLGL